MNIETLDSVTLKKDTYQLEINTLHIYRFTALRLQLTMFKGVFITLKLDHPFRSDHVLFFDPSNSLTSGLLLQQEADVTRYDADYPFFYYLSKTGPISDELLAPLHHLLHSFYDQSKRGVRISFSNTHAYIAIDTPSYLTEQKLVFGHCHIADLYAYTQILCLGMKLGMGLRTGQDDALGTC